MCIKIMELTVHTFPRHHYPVSHHFTVNIGMFLESLCGKCVMWGLTKWRVGHWVKKILHMFVTGNRIDKLYHFDGILNLSCIIWNF